MAGKTKYPTPESAQNRQTAYQSVNQSAMGPNLYNPVDPLVQPYLNFVSASDETAKQIAFQNLLRGWTASADMVPQGSKYRNNFEYMQAIIRGLNLSDAKTVLGVADAKGKDINALQNVLTGAIGMNLSLPDYLSLLSSSGGTGNAVKQMDTTTKYNKQISTSLQLLDESDAKSRFSDSYFKAYGVNPSNELITSFKNAWNAESKSQLKTTTTDYITTYEKVYDKSKPIIDPKTKKPKLDAQGKPMYQQKSVGGVLQWKPVTKSPTVMTGEGFTAEEQNSFLAEYMVQNFPEENFNMESLGGAAKSVYDEIIASHKNNYSDMPDFAAVAPTIKAVLGTSDAGVAKEILTQYSNKLRSNIATKYMGLADWVNAGNDASEKIDPLLKNVSTFLESDVTLNDNLMKQILNFQGSDGKYRLPNDYELNQLLVNDSRYAKTSTAINESVNVAQALTSRLRIS